MGRERIIIRDRYVRAYDEWAFYKRSYCWPRILLALADEGDRASMRVELGQLLGKVEDLGEACEVLGRKHGYPTLTAYVNEIEAVMRYLSGEEAYGGLEEWLTEEDVAQAETYAGESIRYRLNQLM